MHHGLVGLRGAERYAEVSHERTRGDRFGRLFPDLPGLYLDPGVLTAIGRPGGGLDSGAGGPRTATVDVGMVFFGQFVDHDLTLDVSSSLGRVTDPGSIGNVRTPTLDLDSVYGAGPEANPFLYHHGSGDRAFDGAKLLTGADSPGANPRVTQDLPRAANGRAIIGDHRNDENRIISQLHLAVLRAHNRICDHLNHTSGLIGGRLHDEARRLLTRHYQWLVINDFLPAICGRPVVDDILANGRRWYRPAGDPFIPVEFSVAAYRFGHSMVPQEIQVRTRGRTHPLFGEVLGGGSTRLPSEEAIVDWRLLFDLDPDHPAQKAERLDTMLASTLLALPFLAAPEERSLANRNLLRGQGFLLPSGENVARCLDRPDDEVARVSEAADAAAGGLLGAGTPLWLYLLAEAGEIGRAAATGVTEPGEGLGPVGARIVAEVILGLLEEDPRSLLGSDRAWHPAREPVAGRPITTVGGLVAFGSPPL